MFGSESLFQIQKGNLESYLLFCCSLIELIIVHSSDYSLSDIVSWSKKSGLLWFLNLNYISYNLIHLSYDLNHPSYNLSHPFHNLYHSSYNLNYISYNLIHSYYYIINQPPFYNLNYPPPFNLIHSSYKLITIT